MEDTMSAREAAKLLGVKLPTLYAYVSRGLLRSLPSQRGRARRYVREDLERLRARRDVRGASAAAANALQWGEPVLDSEVTQVTREGPRYRGRSAVDLARAGVSFERVAELLWTGSLPDADPDWPSRLPGVKTPRASRLGPQDASPLTRLAVLVPTLAAHDPGRFDRRPRAVLPRARRVIQAMAASLGEGPGERVAQRLAKGLRARGGARAARAIDQGLVLWADHELNVSAFAARVAASAGADVYSCVAAGLAALSGPRHGAACDQIEAVVAEAGRPERAERVLHERARRGDAIPGFGHPFYPDGDPRAIPLLETAQALAPRDLRLRTILAIVEAQRELHGLHPAVDTGIVALCAALRLPPGTAPGLIAVGRCAGWVAHILEQYAAGFLIRPRARFPRPEPVRA